MARVSEAFLNQYQPMAYTDLKKPIIFIVDMINGFVFDGALHDTKIHDISMNIKQLLDIASCRSIFVADAHPPKTREFQSFPMHCVIGTKESEVIDDLQPYIHELFHKNSTNTFTSQDFQTFLQDRLQEYQDIVITGCCSDICILQFALCLNAWLNEHNKSEYRILLPINCIDTYHIEGIHDAIEMNEFSIANMQANGIHVLSAFKEEEA